MSDVIVRLVQHKWDELYKQINDPSVRRARIEFRAAPPLHINRGDRVFVVAHNRIQCYAYLEELVKLDDGITIDQYNAVDKHRKARIEGPKLMRNDLHLKRMRPTIVFLCRNDWLACTEWDPRRHIPKRYGFFLGYRYPKNIDERLVAYPYQNTDEEIALRKHRLRQVRMYYGDYQKREYTWVSRASLTDTQRVLLAWGNDTHIPRIFPTNDGTIIALLQIRSYDVRSVRDYVWIAGRSRPVYGWAGTRDLQWQADQRARQRLEGGSLRR